MFLKAVFPRIIRDMSMLKIWRKTLNNSSEGVQFSKVVGWRPAVWLRMNSSTGIFRIYHLIFGESSFKEWPWNLLIYFDKLVKHLFTCFLHPLSSTTAATFVWGCWGELVRLDGLAHLGQIIFISRSYEIFYLISIKKFVMPLEKD